MEGAPPLARRRGCPGYPRPSAPRIEIRGLCSPGDPPPRPPPSPCYPRFRQRAGGQRRAALAPEEEEGIMVAPKFIDIDGRRFVWRDLLQRRRAQLAATAKVEQAVLFELK